MSKLDMMSSPRRKRSRPSTPTDGDGVADEELDFAAFPPEVLASIASFCRRGALDAFALASTRTRDVCRDPRRVTTPWPTDPRSPFVGAICPDLDDLPDEPAERYDDFDDTETDEYRVYREELRGVTPPPSTLIMLHDAFGPSFLALQNEGIRIKNEGEYVKPRTMQIWSKECGIVFEEHYPYFDTKPAITPPLGEGGQFLIIAARRHERPGVRMVELKRTERENSAERSFNFPCNQHVQNFKCVGGRDDPCLIFMDRGESAVKLCRMTTGEERGADGGVERLELSEPEVLVSDTSRTGDLNTRRGRLATFSDSKRSIIAFSYDLEDVFINFYDMKRKVSVAVPTPDGAGWIRDMEFSPDGKLLAVAHCTFVRRDVPLSSLSNCAISVYDCDIGRIECVAQHSPPKLFRIKESGYCSHISFSPKGTKIAFQWHHQDGYRTNDVFEHKRVVGTIDLSSALKDGNESGQISVELLDELAWEKFVFS